MANSFSRPPLDGTLTVDQLYDWHRVHSPNAAAFAFREQGSHNTTLTWREVGEGLIKGTEIIKSYISETQSTGNLPQQRDPIVVGILATTDLITYTTFLFSHIRLTHPNTSSRRLLPFPISPRNSAAAVANLIRVTGVKYLWVTEGSMRTMAEEAQHQGGLEDIVVLAFPSFSELYPDPPCSFPSIPHKDDNAHVAFPLNLPAVIFHSSGSTAFPKPRTLTHAMLLEFARYLDMGGLQIENETMAVHNSPMFHAMGMFTATWPLTSGFVRAATPPGVSQPPLTPEAFLQSIIDSNSTTLLTVPSFLEAWATQPSSIRELKKLKMILWGGGPLRPDIGHLLYDEGVRIHPLYGATELGCVSLPSAKRYAEGYEWFEFPRHIFPELIPDEDSGAYELVLKECEKLHLAVYNTEINGEPAYATSDLVERHKSDPSLFRVIGRKDDQIMLSTGEKTNPGPLEAIIVNNPHVQNAVMFGRARLSNGVIIEPASNEEAETMGVEKFRNLIWPSIEAANAFAPAHSRIFKEMILVASANKPFSYTAKNTARRGAILNDYAEEIDAIYRAVADTSQTDVPIPPGSSSDGGWTLEESLKFVHSVVHSILTGAESMGDEDDLFGSGCDSLQATYIRNTLLHALRQVAPANSRKVPSNVVYQYPTIRLLAAFAAQVSHSAAAPVDKDAEEGRRKRLLELVAKYTKDLPKHTPTNDTVCPTDETILLTGSTGGLGSQLLAQLVVIPSISRIFAFNRPAKKSSRDRHLEAFVDRGNDVAILDSAKIIYIEGDTEVEGFNIKPELFAKIRDSVTTIIHNAWRVNFNISLSSFEPALQGVRHIIDLALQSPHHLLPRVIFTSSIGNVKAWSTIPPVAEAPFSDLALINSVGYSESKWVSERILWTAGQSTSLRPVIVRVGQLCGGINGNWNSREWFPSLVRAAQVVGGLPNNEGLVSFLPLHAAASAIIELRHTSSEYVHIVHPRPVPWGVVIGHVSDILGIPVIPYNEWLTRLEASPKTEDALHRNPALHLMDFYRASATPKDTPGAHDKEVMGLATYETTVTVSEAPSLGPARLAQLEKEDAENWICYWKDKGVLDV